MTKIPLVKAFLLIGLIIARPGYAGPEEDTVPDNLLKAVYLIHLSEFTNWPEPKMQAQNFTICLDAHSDLLGPLDEVQSKRQIKGKDIGVKTDLALASLPGCHIFYVSKATLPLFKQAQQSLAEHSVLTVSSEAEFVEMGGHIQYYLDDNQKIRMRANVEALDADDLQMSSKILRLMDIFGEEQQP